MGARNGSGSEAIHLRDGGRHQRATTAAEHAPTQTGEDDEQHQQELPQPPEVQRRMRWRFPQFVGLALISVMPVLAAARLLDPTPQVAHASGGGMELSVSAPNKLRYRMSDWMFLDVRNASGKQLQSVTVEVDAPFVEGFAQASFMPEPARIDERRYAIDLGQLRAGETRRVSVQVQAEKYGKRTGAVTAVADGGRATVPVQLFVLP